MGPAACLGSRANDGRRPMKRHLALTALVRASRRAAGVSALIALLALAPPAAAEQEAPDAGVDPAAGAPSSPPPRSESAAAPRRLRFCAGLKTGNYTFA